MSFQEETKRSIVKSITFRTVVMIFDFTIIMTITHRYDVAFTVIIASNVASTVLYYFHERAWNGIMWGRKHESPVSKVI